MVVEITLMGGKECEVDTHIFEVDLRAKDGSVVTIEVYGVDYITDSIPIPNIAMIGELFPDVDCQQLSRSSECVDILVGVDNEDISPGNVVAQVGKLRIKQSVFGMVLQGPLADKSEVDSGSLIGCHAVVNDEVSLWCYAPIMSVSTCSFLC